MGLVLKVKPGDRLLVNGAVLRNAGRGQMIVEVENRSDVLRGEEILNEAMARTPVRRLCHLIQLAIVDREAREDIRPHIFTALDELAAIMARSQGAALSEARRHIEDGRLYNAYRALRPVIRYEDDLLAMAANEPGVTSEAIMEGSE